MAGKIAVSGQDVIVILRHDPASSDPVDVAAVLTREVLGYNSQADDDDVVRSAEMWAIDREIEFIKEDANGGTDEQVEFANSLNRTNLTPLTDLWFEPIIMPVTERIL